MASVILISSSPPSIFPRSPTSSPGLNALLKDNAEGRHRFKTLVDRRSGLELQNAEDVLKPKRGAENLWLTNIKEVQDVNKPLLSTAGPVRRRTDNRVEPSRPCSRSERRAKDVISSGQMISKGNHIAAGEATYAEASAVRPYYVSIAVPRKLDWTPPSTKQSATADDSPEQSESFARDLMASFGHSRAETQGLPLAKQDNPPATKRRRLDLVESGVPKSDTDTRAVKIKSMITSTIKKSKPVKKYTTITGLSTSLYKIRSVDAEDSISFMQSTNPCQLQAPGIPVESDPPKPRKRATRASKKAKQAAPKFTILSPTSAMKIYEGQDIVFGSASQLAQTESPTRPREIPDRSTWADVQLFSDPPANQSTQPISIESTTPRATKGTSKYANKRDLWAAAGRDEDNALLHVDTVDLFDTPAIRNAFAGKAVMLEPNTESQHGGVATAAPDLPDKFCNIDDIQTPDHNSSYAEQSKPLVQRRSIHTSSTRASPRRSKEAPAVWDDDLTSSKRGPLNKQTQKARPTKPSYDSYTTSELQKQITAFGFKPIKKRETMIDILERCWEDKHGQVGPKDAVAAPAENVEHRKHGDFLSNVHNTSSRPALKPKKPRKPRTFAPKSQSKEAQKQKKTSKATRKTKAPIFEEPVFDIEDVVHGTFIESPLPKDESVALEAPSVTSKAAEAAMSPLTLQSEKDVHQLVAMTEEQQQQQQHFHLDELIPPSPLSQPDMQEQITRAVITFMPPPELNHQKHPTWHEKILMYDPIVLEDLTLWLNTTGLGCINEDREVEPLQVRAWCEQRGICCLWKGGWRGNGKV